MSFFSNLFKGKTLAEDTIKANTKTYGLVKKERPNKDEHFYLATTYLRRLISMRQIGQDALNTMKEKYNLSEQDENELLSMMAYNETKTFSILEPPDSIRALSLYVVFKEIPEAAKHYGDEFNKLAGEAINLRDSEKFEKIYKRKNPKSAKHFV